MKKNILSKIKNNKKNVTFTNSQIPLTYDLNKTQVDSHICFCFQSTAICCFGGSKEKLASDM